MGRAGVIRHRYRLGDPPLAPLLPKQQNLIIITSVYRESDKGKLGKQKGNSNQENRKLYIINGPLDSFSCCQGLA
jgi:hypothetical protein